MRTQPTLIRRLPWVSVSRAIARVNGTLALSAALETTQDADPHNDRALRRHRARRYIQRFAKMSSDV
jgi:hypothetical protein